jgi:hypothetical protein
MQLQNQHFRLEVDPASGAITSLVVEALKQDLIGTKGLAANFRICLPLENYIANYIEGHEQQPDEVRLEGDTIRVRFSHLKSAQGEFAIDLEYTIRLADDQVIFRAKLTNHEAQPISEFWFPRLGGWTRFGSSRQAKLYAPAYTTSASVRELFKGFSGAQGLGAEAAELSSDYPQMPMPWWDVYDAESNVGLYLGYHDTTCRFSSWHFYLYPTMSGQAADAWLLPEQSGGRPVGLVFSHVRYPYIRNGETFDTGEFAFRVHPGDWHQGSQHYRQWFLRHFPVNKSGSWLRREHTWYSVILQQPEDKIVADYEKFDQWCREAEAYGIRCFELIGWDKGGLERDYPEYVPEEKLGGRAAFRKLMKSINARGSRCLAFVNYNVLDSQTDWYKRELHACTHQDGWGDTPNWMCWGEGTLLARKGLTARRHRLASVVPEFQKILEELFARLVEDGARGLQMDKVCVGSTLDFNPRNTLKPDVALCEGLVQGIERIVKRMREIDPEFCLASEAQQDRLLPFWDVAYRCSEGPRISTLRYVFPEWTSCQHIGLPRDFNGVNGAVVTGSVIVVEPENYQTTMGDPLWAAMGDYVREIGRLRTELASVIFLGTFLDNQGVAVHEEDGGHVLAYAGHAESAETAKPRRALTVMNPSGEPRRYRWAFTDSDVAEADLYAPFQKVRRVAAKDFLELPPESLHIVVAR